MRRKALFAIPVVLLIVAGAAFAVTRDGGGNDEESVRTTVNDFVTAGNDRDWKKVCSLFGKEPKSQIEQSGKCDKVLGDAASKDDKQKTKVDITEVEIEGSKATANAKVSRGKSKAADQTLILAKEDGDWKITGFGQ